MTKTLLEHFKSLEDNDWDYYNFGDKLKNPFTQETNSEEQFRDFIDDYFKSSGKRDGLFDNSSKEYFDLIDNRAYHTVSVFYLGILIRKSTYLSEILYTDEVNKPGYPKFPFIWFLTVLFHDFGMVKETDDVSFQNFECINDIYSKFELKQRLLESKFQLNIPKTLYDNVEKYFKYRISDKNLDHGVLGGIYMYGKLVETRIMKKREIEMGTYCGNRLNWDETLNEQYALASSVLCCHNIWLTHEGNETFSLYEKHDLLTLDKANFKPVSSRDFPLFFLFGLVDTIDPVKGFIQKYELIQILKLIKIKITKRTLRILNRGIENEDFDLYFVKISNNLNDWLKLTIIMENKKTILIKF